MTSAKLQIGEDGGIDTNLADMLHKRTGIRAVLPGLFVLTTLGHTDNLDDRPSSIGSVNADSESRLFRAKPDIVRVSFGCKTTSVVVLTTPTLSL